MRPCQWRFNPKFPGSGPDLYYRNSIETSQNFSKPVSPVNALPDALTKTILDLLHSERFVDCTPYEVYYTLLDEGQYYASIRTFYRLLSEQGETQDRRNQRTHRDALKPELMATAANQVWSWDSVPQKRSNVKGGNTLTVKL